MSFISFIDIIMEGIFKWKSESLISSLDFNSNSTNNGFIWSPWVWNKSSSVEKSWSNNVSFEILFNSTLFHVPSNNFDWWLWIISDLNLMKSIIGPVVTLFNISWIKVIMGIVVISKVICWVNIWWSHKLINYFYIF